MARPFPSIRKPSAGWTGAVNYTLEDHIASSYPHPIYPRKDGVLPNDSITRHMLDAGAHRKYFLSTAELIFTKADYESSKELNGETVSDATYRESNLHQILITAPALAEILRDYSASGGFSYKNLVKEILGAPGSHTYKMCTDEDDIKAPSIGLFVDLFDKFNAVVGVLPSQSRPTVATPTSLTSVFALKSHTHAAYESHGSSHNEIWEAINAGGGGSGGVGGVIDGTLCTDAATGEPCVTEIALYENETVNNQASYTYTVQHNCLLFIQLKNAIIADNESSSVPRDCILVKANEQVIGTLTDNMQDLWNELDNDGLRIPVKVGTTITLVGDGTTPIFDGTSLTADSKIVFSEFELTPLSMRIGLPDYNTPTDITDNVCRTSLDESKNYTAAADGFVLFRCVIGYNVVSVNVHAVGKVAGVDVYDAFYQSGSDASTGSGLVPVRKGDVIDCITSDRAGTTYVANDGKFEIIFYPLVGAEHTEGEGPIEYPVLEHAFTDTTDNPFIGTSIPSADNLTITSAKIENLCGRSNIDLNTCHISLKIDVFTPKMNGSTVVVDDNGFAEIDKTHPVYRNEAIVYCDADNSPAGYYNDYSRHLDVSIVGGAAKIAWTDAFKKSPAANSVAASFTLPALSSLLEANTGKTSWDDFNNSYGKFIDVASDLGLSNCYIRLTAVIDPCTKIIKQAIGDKIPNGISPTSRMVRQADMNLIATASGATRTYSNEITVTESGWCIIHANYDTDGSILNGTTTYSVQIQALINNVWTDVAMQDNKSLPSSINTDSGWDFAFPVEAGLKLRAQTNFGNGGTGLTDYKSGTYPYTRRQQALCWVIPTSKYLAPEYNLPGSAGVIDGSIWKDADGNDLVTNITIDTTVKEITYNVKNDCYLMVALYNTDIGGGSTADCRECIDIVVNGVVAGCLHESNQNGNTGFESGVCSINVARGSVVKLLHHQNNGTNVYKLFDAASSGNSNPKLNGLLTFTEFKLRATNVVAAMPDWDTSKDQPISSGSAVPADGWVVITRADSSTGTCSINGVKVFDANVTTNANNNCATVPVSKGDVVTFSGGATVPTVTFYPVKMHKVSTASAIEVIAMSSRSDSPSWWKVYSNGWCEQGGYIASTVSGVQTVNLSIPYNDALYHAGADLIRSDGTTDGNNATAMCTGRTTNAVTIWIGTTLPAQWEAKGWISDASLTAIKQGKVWDHTADSNAGAWVDPS